MHVENILHQILGTSIHKTRVKTLNILTTGLITSKIMKLSSLGRVIKTTKERAGILRVDRFLRNQYYQNHSHEIYKVITSFVLHHNPCPDIIVDWSKIPNSHYINQDGEHYVLRASYAATGRAITLYEEVHPKKNEGNFYVHKSFLETLHSFLPKDCIPCIISDAGFKTPWFKTCLEFNWNFVGRIACGTSCFNNGKGFQSVRNLFKKAKNTPCYLGRYVLTKSRKLETNFYILKSKSKGRHKWTRTFDRKVAKDKSCRKHGKSNREPWVLVSTYSGKKMARTVINKYKLRMTIEEGFRDTKSTITGLSMNENITIKPERLIVWFMLAALASIVAWIVGYVAEQEKIHYDFQANTYKHRRVLSLFYLGCQVIRKNIEIPIDYNIVTETIWAVQANDS